MLRHQLDNFAMFDSDTRKKINVIIVDDCSPEPAEAVIGKDDDVRLYRIKEDIPWNRSMVRNLGAHVAETKWIVNVDTDHEFPPMSANALFKTHVDSDYWYRFPRVRIGAADETRRKDEIPESCEFGGIKPHIDSHMMTRELFMRSPYDEDYSGCLGGGSPFLARMTTIATPKLMSSEVHLYVYTRHVVPDASIFTLDRDTSEYKRRRRAKEAAGDTKPKRLLRYDWERLL